MTPALNLIAGDQPTTCPVDGRRTVWLGDRIDDDDVLFHVEQCTACERIFHVYEPDTDDDARCTQCGEPNDNGEGWNGLCGDCADRAENGEDDDE